MADSGRLLPFVAFTQSIAFAMLAKGNLRLKTVLHSNLAERLVTDQKSDFFFEPISHESISKMGENYQNSNNTKVRIDVRVIGPQKANHQTRMLRGKIARPVPRKKSEAPKNWHREGKRSVRIKSFVSNNLI